MEIEFISYFEQEPVIIGKRYIDCRSVENYPIDSALLGIFQATQLNNIMEKWPVRTIKKKAFKFFFENSFYFYPLIHSNINT